MSDKKHKKAKRAFTKMKTDARSFKASILKFEEVYNSNKFNFIGLCEQIDALLSHLKYEIDMNLCEEDE